MAINLPMTVAELCYLYLKMTPNDVHLGVRATSMHWRVTDLRDVVYAAADQ